MIPLASSVKSYFSIKQKNVSIVNWVFGLHHRVTFGLLLLSTLIVSSTEWIGEKILCTHSDVEEKSSKKLNHVINQYCFFMSLYTVKEHQKHGAIATGEVAHPGVGPWDLDGDENEIEYLRWYQWVPFFLSLQAILFYVPYLIWQIMEKGALRRIVLTFSKADLESPEKKNDMLKQTIDSMWQRLESMKYWASLMYFCEVLNLINVFLQFWFTDVFLGGKFWTLGSEAAEHYGDEKYNPLDIAFPKVAKCTFRKYGPTGSIQINDVACVLSTNIANEKIFLILWWWYIALIIVSAGMIIYRLVARRVQIFSVRYGVKSVLANIHAKFKRSQLEVLAYHLDYNEWVIFSYILSNLEPLTAEETLAGVCDQILREEKKKTPLPVEKQDLLSF